MEHLQTVLSWLVPIMLAWVVLSVMYWRLARRTFHDAILFRIYEKRDRLRSLAIEGEVNADSFEYEFLEKRLCQTAYASPEITVFNFIRFCLSDESKEPSPELDRFCREASPDVQRIWVAAIDDVKLMMLANSPVVATIGFAFVAVKGLHQVATEPVKRFFENQVVGDGLNFATA